MAGAIGGNVTIQCRPEAAPFPEITWYRNGANLNPGTDSGSRVQLTIEGDLKMRELSSADEGSYECRAKNELGEDRNRTYLRIMRKYFHHIIRLLFFLQKLDYHMQYFTKRTAVPFKARIQIWDCLPGVKFRFVIFDEIIKFFSFLENRLRLL